MQGECAMNKTHPKVARSDCNSTDGFMCSDCWEWDACQRQTSAGAPMHNRAEALAQALVRITKIRNKMFGGDWDEIDRARGIARAALEAWRAQPKTKLSVERILEINSALIKEGKDTAVDFARAIEAGC